MSRAAHVLDIAHRKVVTCRSDESLPAVAQMMLDHWIGSVIVVGSEKPIGIVTDGTIFKLIAKKRNPLVLTARDVMVSPVFTIHEDRSILDTENEFLKTKVKRLVLVNDTGKLVGIISKKDVDQYTRFSLARRIMHQRRDYY